MHLNQFMSAVLQMLMLVNIFFSLGACTAVIL